MPEPATARQGILRKRLISPNSALKDRLGDSAFRRQQPYTAHLEGNRRPGNGKEEQEDSAQPSNCPAQAKSELEWATGERLGVPKDAHRDGRTRHGVLQFNPGCNTPCTLPSDGCHS
jgi:hypothetical protein